jgi:hypothetical protein
VTFTTPVPIAANTVYVASYHNNLSGGYAADVGYFANTGVDSWPLHALQSDALSGGNGVYSYGTSTFPTHSTNSVNYWVDVVFGQTTIDASPLDITDIKVTVIDGSRAGITWTTSRDATSRIDYSTDPDFPPASTFTVQDTTAFVTQHSMTLTGLTPNATYYFAITAVDHTGVAAVEPAPSFSLPGPTLHDTASVDFLAGTQGNTYVAESANGEVTLAPTAGSEFSGPAMPAGWTKVNWAPEGAIGNGAPRDCASRPATRTGWVRANRNDDHDAVRDLHEPALPEFSANSSGDQSQYSPARRRVGIGTPAFRHDGRRSALRATNPGTGSVDTALAPPSWDRSTASGSIEARQRITT